MLDTILLRIAKTAILSRFDSAYKIDKESLIKKYPYLAQDGATFVTLNYDGNLRGCIGSIVAHRDLLDDILSNAASAAFNDPRFSSLDADELSHLTLEVSLLSSPHILDYNDYEDLLAKVRPHIDGLILKHGIYQGTFLPQVWEQLPSSEKFLEHLSYKAGANPSIYNEHPAIYRYTVDSIEEKFDEVLPL
ncbi:AmmeMemoRadiSam system protein A [Sulfurimonas sp. HSL-1716]|uniref:AmmeMemoRadiSam system protein A n=1 Tax=Hydrocurvibacter sulfurireducens TaxID=3131937 RepID=UPI0031FA2E39